MERDRQHIVRLGNYCVAIDVSSSEFVQPPGGGQSVRGGIAGPVTKGGLQDPALTSDVARKLEAFATRFRLCMQ